MHPMQKCHVLAATISYNAGYMLQHTMLYALCIIFLFVRHQRLRLSKEPCSAAFPFLLVHSQTRSVIGFKFLHHKRLELGFLQPCQITTNFHQQDIIYLPLTTLNRAPHFSPHEALAPLVHNEPVKKRGAD